MNTIYDIYSHCVAAIINNILIHRESAKDKEFHFQNWVRDCLASTNIHFEEGGRNSYPDFRMVHQPEGIEVKGLAYPGRWLNYDSNSQVPTGWHNGRTIYYTFGRYPKQPDGNTYPVLDLVICHGDFLNANHNYIHKNKSLKGFGSYGDIMIRDRKMYVAPTPYGLLDGVAHTQTLILPVETEIPDGFNIISQVTRQEVDELVVSYKFDLRTNELSVTKTPNPHAGHKHIFHILRLENQVNTSVTMRADTSKSDSGENN